MKNESNHDIALAISANDGLWQSLLSVVIGQDDAEIALCLPT